MKILLVVLTLGALLLNPLLVWGQQASVSQFPGDLWDDSKSLFTTENAWWLLGGTAGTILVYQFEDPDGAMRGLDQGLMAPLADFGNIWGDARLQGTLALGLWAVGSWQDSDEVAGLGYDLSRSLLLTYGVTSVLKVAVQRTRPNGENYSFPSGHTSAAFSTAGVVSRRYGGWATAGTLALGVLTGLGRMEDEKHFASDVVAGATIGWIIGRTVAREGKNSETAWNLTPTGQGLVVSKSF